MNKKLWIYSGFSPPDLHEEGETVLFSVSCQSQEKSNQVSGNPNGHWCITAIFALTGVCMLLSHRSLPALLQFNNTFGYNDFFSHLFKNTPHITPIMPIMIRAGKENWVWLAKRKWGEKNQNIWSESSREAVEIIGAGHGLWCHVVLLLSLAGCDTKTGGRAGR